MCVGGGGPWPSRDADDAVAMWPIGMESIFAISLSPTLTVIGSTEGGH